MSISNHEMDQYVGQWWLFFAAALFLLIPLDLLTTLMAVSKYGTVVEANPIMRWLLEQGLFAVTAVNLVVVGIVVYMFHAGITRIRQAPASSRRAFAHVVNVWVGVLLGAGVVLVANNVIAIL